MKLSRSHVAGFVVFILMTSLFGCTMYQNVTAYFNTYYNAKSTFDDAVADLEKTPRTDLDTNYFEIPAAKTSNGQTKFDKVIEKCSKLIQYYPKSGYVDDAMLLLEKSGVYLGESELAIRKYEEMQQNFPESELRFEAKFWYAKALYFSNKPDDAILVINELFPEAQKAGENEIAIESQMLAAQISFKRGDYQSVVDYLTKAVGISGDKAVLAYAQYELAFCLEKLNHYDKAASAYKHVSDFSPDMSLDFKSKLRYGVMLDRTDQSAAALKVFNQLNSSTLKPEEQAMVDHEVANVYADLGDSTKAFNLYVYIDTTYKKTDAAAHSYYREGVLMEEVYGDYKKAQDFYDKAKLEYTNSEIVPAAKKRSDYLTNYFNDRAAIRSNDSLYAYYVNKDTSKAAVTTDSTKKDSTQHKVLAGDSSHLAPNPNDSTKQAITPPGVIMSPTAALKSTDTSKTQTPNLVSQPQQAIDTSKKQIPNVALTPVQSLDTTKQAANVIQQPIKTVDTTKTQVANIVPQPVKALDTTKAQATNIIQQPIKTVDTTKTQVANIVPQPVKALDTTKAQAANIIQQTIKTADTTKTQVANIAPQPVKVIDTAKAQAANIVQQPIKTADTTKTQVANVVPQPVKALDTTKAQAANIIQQPIKAVDTTKTQVANVVPQPVKALDTTKAQAANIVQQPIKIVDTTKTQIANIIPQPGITGDTTIAIAPFQPRNIAEARTIRREGNEGEGNPAGKIHPGQIPQDTGMAAEGIKTGKHHRGGPDSLKSSKMAAKQVAPPVNTEPTYDSLDNLRAKGYYELGSLFWLEMNLPDSAEAMFSTIVDSFPASSYVPRALYTLAQLYRSRDDTCGTDSLYRILHEQYAKTEYGKHIRDYFGEKSYDDTLKNVDSMEVRYSSINVTPDSAHALESIRKLQTIVDEHPQLPIAAKAEYTIGWIYENVLYNNDSAYSAYSNVMAWYPNSEYTAVAKPKVSVKDDPKTLSQFIQFKEIQPIAKTTKKTEKKKKGGKKGKGQQQEEDQPGRSVRDRFKDRTGDEENTDNSDDNSDNTDNSDDNSDNSDNNDNNENIDNNDNSDDNNNSDDQKDNEDDQNKDQNDDQNNTPETPDTSNTNEQHLQSNQSLSSIVRVKNESLTTQDHLTSPAEELPAGVIRESY